MKNRIRKDKKNRGSAYVMVLAISLLVSVIGVAALSAVRVQIRSVANTNDCEEARLYAQSGLELARNWINSDTNWRTNRTSGSTASMSFGAGSFSVNLLDPVDNDFTNSPLDPVKITVIGYKGAAQQQLQVTLTPSPTAYTCLKAALTGGASLTINSGKISSSGIIASNSSISLSSGASVDANVESTGAISGTNYLGSKTTGVTARTMPGTTAFDYYTANGTTISFASVSSSTLQNVLLSPSSNPFGSTNASGIYVIDCGGNTITIRNCRVFGTLVILNSGSGSKVDQQINFAPAVINYPALMVKGAMSLQYDNTNLNEASANTNFNPPGTPYNGASNSTSSDTYPSTINGLVYISGACSMKNNTTIGGPLVVGGAITSDNNVSPTYSSAYLTNPPPGFFDTPQMKISGSSWAQSVNR